MTGSVLDKTTGQPLAGATISNPATGQTTTTGPDGSFRIRATEGQTVQISYVGYQSALAPVQRGRIEVQLELDAANLAEVMVTGALGFQRLGREVGGSARSVENKALNQGKVVNPLVGLASKVAGLRINVYDSKVDPQIQIMLRGARSLTRSSGIDGRNANAPLFVVDGVPVPDISRLNPNDIAGVTVLKGAGAAALYGSEGVNGALMITTRSGKSGRAAVSFNHATTFSGVYLLPPAQRKFGQGNNGVYDPTQYESWGPAFDGSMKEFGLPLPDGTTPMLRYAAPDRDNRLNLFQTGIQVQNDLSVSGGDANSTYFLSMQHVSTNGIIPKDRNARSGVRFNGSRKMGRLHTSYAFNYVHSDLSMTPDGPWIGAYRYPANFDFKMVRNWEDPLSPGNPLNYFTSQGSWLRNPYFLIDNIRNETLRQTLNGKVELRYQVTDWFEALYRVGFYSDQDETRSYTRKFEAPGTRNVPGVVTDGNNGYRRINGDLMVRFKKEFGRWNLGLLAGQNIRSDYRKSTSVGVTNSSGSGQLLFPDLINPDSRTGNLAGSVAISRYRAAALYGELTAGYDRILYVTLTGRNDWVSVLSKNNRSYFYPGISLSYIASESLEFLRNSGQISFLKLYASWNRTGNVTLAPYQLNNTYSQTNGFPFGNVAGFLPGSTNPNPNIHPEFVRSYEGGFQMTLFRNRLNIEATYVFTDSRGQILNANTSTATGYSVARVNAGRLTNNIIELGLDGDIIRNRDWRWNMGIQFTYIRNVLRELYGGATEINNFRQSYGIVGEVFPSLLVSDYRRDPEGRVVVDAVTGDPLVAVENTHLGTLVPPYQTGISQEIRWKDLTLRAQFDCRLGGWLYSEIVPAMYAAGTDPRTAAYDRQPFVWPNSVIEIEPGKYVPNTDKKTSSGGRAFWSKQGEVQINTAAKSDFFKLRELNLRYALPDALLRKFRIFREASLGLVATNLFIIRHVDNKYGDPEYLYNNTDGYLSFRQVPPYRSMGFHLNVGF